MLEVKIEGIYESDIGSGEKKFYPFEYTYKTARINQKGLFTHALKRHAPYLIQKDKNKNNKLFSRIQTMNISDIKVLDEECYLEGKDINELNDWEIQDLACLYDLYDIPLYGVYSIGESREKATLAYMEYVLNIPMKTNREKDALDFFEKEDDGTYKLNLKGQKVIIEIEEALLNKKKNGVAKKGLSDFIQNAGRTLANGILNMTGNKTAEDSDENFEKENDEMPSINDLLINADINNSK